MLKGFRFQREIKVFPWLKINLSKTGLSASIGPDNAHITVGKNGTWVYADVPGKGTYFRRKLDPLMEDLRSDDAPEKKTGGEDKSKDEAEESQEQESLIHLGFLRRLTTSDAEVAFVDAVEALHSDRMDEAYTRAREAASTADGAFLAGFLAMHHQQWLMAIEYFERAIAQREHLGELFARFEVDARVYLPVSEVFMVALTPTRRDCLLALAKAYDHIQQYERAIEALQELRAQYDPHDLIVRVLLAELYDKQYGDTPRVQHEIIKLAEGVTNESPLHATLMYYRGKALRRLDVLEGARDTLTQALRKKKDYPADLLAALRYERARVYEADGQEKRAHEEFQKIYAVAPELEDVAERLGIVAPHQPIPPALENHVVNPQKIDEPVEFELEATHN